MKYSTLFIELMRMCQQLSAIRFWALWVLAFLLILGFALPRIVGAIILLIEQG